MSLRDCTADEDPVFCAGCGLDAGSPVYAIAIINGIEINVCGEECMALVSARETVCTFCDEPTPTDDRLRVVNGGVPGVAHALCKSRVQNALGLEVAAKLQQRGMNVLPGGRS